MGDLAYIAYYTEGLRVVDISDPTGRSGRLVRHLAGGVRRLQRQLGGLSVHGQRQRLLERHPDRAVRRALHGRRGSVAGDVREPVGAAAAPGRQDQAAGTGGGGRRDARPATTGSGDRGPTTVVTSLFGFAPDSAPVGDHARQNDTPQDVELVRLPGAGARVAPCARCERRPARRRAVVLAASPLAQTTSGTGAYNFQQVPFGVWAFTASRFGYTPLRHVVSMGQLTRRPRRSTSIWRRRRWRWTSRPATPAGAHRRDGDVGLVGVGRPGRQRRRRWCSPRTTTRSPPGCAAG